MTTTTRENPSIHYCREVKISYGPKKKAAAITGARAAFELARKIVDPCADREHFAAVYLDAKNVPLAWRVIAIGTVSSCLVHPREVLRPGLLVGASALFVVHNHPSGDLTASSEDMSVTSRLFQAAEMMGVRLLDHLILGGRSYFSFAETGRLLPGAAPVDEDRLSV